MRVARPQPQRCRHETQHRQQPARRFQQVAQPAARVPADAPLPANARTAAAPSASAPDASALRGDPPGCRRTRTAPAPRPRRADCGRAVGRLAPAAAASPARRPAAAGPCAPRPRTSAPADCATRPARTARAPRPRATAPPAATPLAASSPSPASTCAGPPALTSFYTDHLACVRCVRVLAAQPP